MKHTKFLKQVADYYLGQAAKGLSLADCVMVLPNKRSAIFLSKYLKRGLGATSFMPRFATITAFAQEYCDSAIASPVELLIILYSCYRRVMERIGRKDQIRSFDSFAFWGKVLLEDFDLVDAHMVDTGQLFKNIKSEREIESTFITPKMADAAKKLGIKRPMVLDSENFWMHVNNTSRSGSAAEKFINLWEILGPLYEEFHKELASRHLAYSGMQSRESAMRISALTRDDFTEHRIAFIGFYVLSKSRHKMFAHLRDLQVADFFWDVASPLLTMPGSNAGRKTIELSKMFPTPDDFHIEPIDDIAKIEVCAVPSNIAQTKVAATILNEWRAESEAKSGNESAVFKPADDEWSIILPDQKLLAPMLTSLPEGIGPYNVAMRMSFANTPFSTLLLCILRLQENSRQRLEAFHFFYKDVLEILSHPYIASLAPDSSQAVKQLITTRHLYNVSADEILGEAPDLAFIFTPVNRTSDIREINAYLTTLFGEFRRLLNLGGSQNAKRTYEEKILEDYERKTEEICRHALAFGIDKMLNTTFFSLLRRILAAQDVEFDGNPVTGLQILGLQDARMLDFDKIIIASLNERVLPTRTVKPSFIPPLLRRGYGIPTHEDEEENLAYQFYRLISRAEHLCLIYDSRSADLARGEISRYLRQLMLIHPEKIIQRDVAMGLSPGIKSSLAVKKDEIVMKELESFLTPGGRNFSASALKAYIKCPLYFYLQNVKGLSTNSFDPQFIDSSSYGTILHEVAKRFYDEQKGMVFDAESYGFILNDATLFSRLRHKALEVMNEKYYGHKYTGFLDRIPGEGRTLAKLMATYIISMLKNEARKIGNGSMRPFRFYAGEKKASDDGATQWRIDARHTINFTLSIDRIDIVEEDNSLRFIDYKTGGDSVSDTTIDKLFTSPEKGAMFQLMTYCLSYADMTHDARDIQPYVYLFGSMATDGIKELVINRKAVVTYKEHAEAFREGLASLLDEIFDPARDFAPANDDKYCAFCTFQEICGRTKKKEL